MHIFPRLCSVLVCWTFIADFYDSSQDLGRNVWDESKLTKCGPWGSKEACKEAQKTQEKAKPAAQGEAPSDPKTQRTGNNGRPPPVGTTAIPWWTPRPVVAATVWPWWAPRPWWSSLHPVVRFSFACLFDFWRFLLCFAFKCWCIWTFQRTQFTP